MEKRCYCVTGGAGYIGSYLVKTLLLKGHTVHATLRDLGDESKTAPLTSLEGAKDRLKLFKADLLEEGAFDEAIQGCHGVFHVATPIPSSMMSEEDLIQIAMKGSLNVLKSCTRTPSVKRVVCTSSVTAACPLNDNGQVHGSMDESSWTPVEILRTKSPNIPIKIYFVAKTITEQALLQYGKENGLDVVTILPTIVGGPFITSLYAISCENILFPITGNEDDYVTAKYMRQFTGSYSILHIEDVCEAHLLLMENPNANGRYLCSAASLSLSELVSMFRHCYPNNILISSCRVENEENEMAPLVEPSSKKLKELGFVFKHHMEDIIHECMRYAASRGNLSEIISQSSLELKLH